MAIKAIIPILFCVLTALGQQAPLPKPIDKAALTAARSIYLMEDGVREGHEDPTYEIFRATLTSTKRFNLLPDAHDADLLLFFEQVPGRTVPPIQPPLLVLSARDPISLVGLGELDIPWAVLPSLTKDQEAVTKLMDALFTQDGSSTVPAFTVATVPVNSLTEHLTTPLSILGGFIPHSISDATKKAAAGAHAVIYIDDGMPTVLPPEYQQTTKAFQSDLTAAGHLRTVLKLSEADLVIRINGYQMWINDSDMYYITASAFAPSTFEPVFTVHVEAKVGKIKKGKPSPFDASVSKLEVSFEHELEKIQKEAAKL